MTSHGDECGPDVAAYALGALPPDEARAFERHVADCELCRADLEALGPVVDQLPRSVDPVEPPPELRTAIMAVVEAEAAERRRSAARERPGRLGFLRLRPVQALAAACVLLLAGIGFALAVTADETRVIQASTSVPGAEAEVRVDDGDATIRLRGMPAPPDGRVYQVWVQQGNAAPEPTDALFTVANDGSASVEVPGGVDGVDRVMITEEPKGGSQVPSGDPAMVARVS